MSEVETGPSGLPRDIEEFLLLDAIRKQNRAKSTGVLTVTVPDDVLAGVAELAEDLQVTRGDLVSYLWQQSGERLHSLREYVKRPDAEGAE